MAGLKNLGKILSAAQRSGIFGAEDLDSSSTKLSDFITVMRLNRKKCIQSPQLPCSFFDEGAMVKMKDKINDPLADGLIDAIDKEMNSFRQTDIWDMFFEDMLILQLDKAYSRRDLEKILDKVALLNAGGSCPVK